LKTISVKMHFVVSVVSETLKNKVLQHLTHPVGIKAEKNSHS